MRKLYLSSIALTAFSVSIIVFQISCQKTAVAQSPTYTLPTATTTNLGGVIVGNGLTVTSNGTLSVTSSGGITQSKKVIFSKQITGGGITEIWTMNYDGSSLAKIPISLPAGIGITNMPLISPDGKKIFFTADDGQKTSREDIYSCNTDGSNVLKLYTNPNLTAGLNLGVAY